MGKIQKPSKAILICAVMYPDNEIYRKVELKLLEKFGVIEEKSEAYDFTFSDYYSEEMGENLKKHFLSLRLHFTMDRLPWAKKTSNSVEDIMGVISEGRIRRRVNIDPGYMTLNKLVLATTKDADHRIYIGDGIYAETTLRFHKGAFEPFPWTYPDYTTDIAKEFFGRIREKLIKP